MIYKTTLSLLVAAFFSSALFAAPAPTALITKTNHPGFVIPEMAVTESCEVYLDKVQIIRQHGHDNKSVRVVEMRNVRIGGNLMDVINQARSEELNSKENNLCDGPSTHIAAGDVLLFTTGGCGRPRQERNGMASRKLRAIVDNYCPRTYTVGTKN